MRFTLKRIDSLIKEALKEEPTGDTWLDARYDEQATLINHSNPYYRLFFLIAKTLKPKVVVELGTWQGTAAAHFAAGWPEARVITIDHHSDPGDEFNRMKTLDVVRRYPNVNYLKGWTSPGFAEEYPEKGSGCAYEEFKITLGQDKIDILFVDSWHEGRYLQRDWDYYSPFLANNSLVIFDDVLDSHLFVDMVSTVSSLPGDKLFNDQVHPHVPMGFAKYELSTSRKADPKKPAAATKPKTRKSRTARK